MALFTSLASLSQTASGNAADGSTDAPSSLDNQLNLLASFIAQLRDANYTRPAGTVLQEVAFAPVTGGITSSGTMSGMATSQSVTPRSANSTLAITVTFHCQQNVLSGVNPSALFAIFAGDAYLTEYQLAASSGAGGVGIIAPITLTGSYINNALTPIGLNLGARTTNTGAPAEVQSIRFTVREVQR